MDTQQRQNNIYLIGMMGAGKTTVGKLLAEELDYNFFDTDIEVEKLAQKTITEIFAREGEAKFRELESQILEQVSTSYNRVIATGGGIVERDQNWNYLRTGLVVWLDADLDLLNQRLAVAKDRPLAEQIESLLVTRNPLYDRANLRIAIESEHTPEDIVAGIINSSIQKAS